MTYVLLLHGTWHERTPHDGRFLKAYDPTWLDEPAEDGRLVAVLESTDSAKDALQFPGIKEAMACWNPVSPNEPWREDGMPNKPLTAYSSEIVRMQ